MLEDIEVSKSFMKRMKSTGEMTEPWGTPTLITSRCGFLKLVMRENIICFKGCTKLFGDYGFHCFRYERSNLLGLRSSEDVSE